LGLSAPKAQPAQSASPIAILRQDGRALLPLPKGEGWGEGESDVRIAADAHFA